MGLIVKPEQTHSVVQNQSSIVFFGTGSVSLESLKFLATLFVIEAVITKTDLKTSSGKRTVGEVALWSQQQGIRVLDANNRAQIEAIFDKEGFISQLGVLIDFGIILPPVAIDYFSLGIINSHFSLLPSWRGADPITFSILFGDKTTGVSIMLVDDGLDTGKILAQKPMKLAQDITTPQLTVDLIALSNQLLANTIPAYLEGQITPQDQNNKIAPSYSRKIRKSDGEIDWTKSATELEREIRAYQPWPASYTKLGNISLAVIQAKISDLAGQPGAMRLEKNRLLVGCGSGSLELLTVKPAGKNNMPIQDFINGYRSRLG